MKDREDEWQALCKLAAVEQDPEKLLKLTRQICDLLDEKERRLRGERGGSSAREGKHIFQVAYNEGLLVTRSEVLKACGYDVVSVLGNDAARRILDKSQDYQLFVLGHDAPREEREEMLQWLRVNFPAAKVLALTSPYESTLPGADYSVPLNNREQWLAAVASVAA